MTVLELRFPTGRFHATPWGRHVNEGAIEWPPSPWRILRALVATWYLKARDAGDCDLLRSLAQKLSTPPQFWLPPATTGHTRHYMPGNEAKHKEGNVEVFGPARAKVFDTFVQLSPNDAVLVEWNMDLSDAERTTLKTLADRLGYLGRAESLVVARLLESEGEFRDATTPQHYEAAPLKSTDPLPPKAELVRLLAPMAHGDYAAWSRDFMARAEAALGPKPTAAQRKKLPRVPADLFAALHADTGDLQAAGWNLPPGAEFVNYTRREDAFAPATRPLSRRKGPLPTVARFAVVSTVAPRITQAVSIGDRVHDALCKWSDQGRGRAAVFTGLDESGKPSADHQHAHIFCEANGPRDAVTHITVWAPMGFDEAACLALRRLNKVWGHGGHDLRLVLHAIGQPGEFPDCGLFAASKVWRSLTPFVSTRHPKTFRDGRPKLDANGWQQGSAAHDLLRLLKMHPHGAGAKIRQLDERERPFRFGRGNLRSLQFQTCRNGGEGRRGSGFGSAFEIAFSEPVTGPLAFGYGSHFGLGLFIPAD